MDCSVLLEVHLEVPQNERNYRIRLDFYSPFSLSCVKKCYFCLNEQALANLEILKVSFQHSMVYKSL